MSENVLLMVASLCSGNICLQENNENLGWPETQKILVHSFSLKYPLKLESFIPYKSVQSMLSKY